MKNKVNLFIVIFLLSVITIANYKLHIITEIDWVSTLINRGVAVCVFLYILYIVLTFLSNKKGRKNDE